MNNKLYFDRSANYFEEACPIGNGSIGAMVYGGCQKERISLNHDTFWSGENGCHKNLEAYSAFCKARELAFADKNDEAQDVIEERFTSDNCEYYLPVGNLSIIFNQSNENNYKRVLDMRRSLVTVDRDFVHTDYFVSYPDRVLVSRIRFDKPSGITVSFDTSVENNVENDGASLIVTGHAPYFHEEKDTYTDAPERTTLYEDRRGIYFTLMQYPITDGTVSFRGDTLSVEGATEIILLTALETSFVRFDKAPDADHRAKAETVLKKAIEIGYEKLFARHIEDVTEIYDKTSLSVTDTENTLTPAELLKNREDNLPILTELMFNFGRYLSIASSRKGSEATNLQGIWNENFYAPWRCDYTVNINTQMNYWHMPMAGLFDCYEPLLDKVEAIAVTGRETAREFYHADGFTCHHNTDVWAHTEPVAKGRKITALFSFWYMSPAWFICQLYDAWQYRPEDLTFARRIYALQKEFCKFCLSILTEYEGKLVLAPATSPEVGFWYNEKFISVCPWTAVNQESCYKLFEDCIELTEILDEDREFANTLGEILPKLQMPVLDDEGRIVEWDKDYKKFDPTNRHVSHCWGLYPGGLYTPDRNPEMAEACRKALIERGLDGTGWSLSWKLSLMAILGDKDKAQELIYRQFYSSEVPGVVALQGGGTYPNLFDAHPSFQIDGNFGFVAGVTNLLVQSKKGEIRLLPTLPDAFGNGSVRGILAKGNIKCDMDWQNGRVTHFSLVSPIRQTVTVIYNSTSVTVKLEANKTYSI